MYRSFFPLLDNGGHLQGQKPLEARFDRLVLDLLPLFDVLSSATERFLV